MILFCIPYAGGSEIIYYKWRKFLDPSIQLVSLELKGRGKRHKEIFYENVEEAVEDLLAMIKAKIADNDYALYGHSMGSLLAYELYYKISDANFRRPTEIFFSGSKAPNLIRKKAAIHTLPDDDFIKKVMEFGGTPEELANNEVLLKIFLPIIRNDLKILENYKYQERQKKIECAISILNGKQDTISSPEDILAWRNHGSDEFRVYNFEGNHFFIRNNIENITRIINRTLCSRDSRSAG